jgi:23S rRNA (guanosine2251-2'-O)-methyltransferase
LKKEEFIYGIHPVLEALKSGKDLDKLLIRKGLKGPAFSELLGLARTSGVPWQFVPEEKLNRVTQKNHQGIIAFTSMITYHSLENLLPGIFEQGKMPLLLILDGITDVRNFGAIARSAECAGIDALVIPEKGSAQVTEDAVRTSAGALIRIPVCRTARLNETLLFLKSCGIILLGTTEKAETLYYQEDLKNPVAFVMGSEDMGISPEILRLCDRQIRIPMMGAIASLNVSVAAGVLLFEAVRQRQAARV